MLSVFIRYGAFHTGFVAESERATPV